ncbi:glycosyltransferase family 9 protein [Thermomicrobiaceae bacterium CFH 74404]|uniref:Glycosyltransferase family 9 protein n=1 Tax=Thermalbibacter longus TaxID=2951981 RepID=A0AA42B972_9BACT|nr:glycosyltransferase family 9 protein [Thermalbibacter longus]MCM8748081.1 glycosyltransferase family 9 protein [Thermalbibacter longus]
MVLHANGSGDFVLALPALEALPATYPDPEIVLLGKPCHAESLRGRPGPVDRVVVMPPCPVVTVPPDAPDDPAELSRFVTALQTGRFDLAIQRRGGGRDSNPLSHRPGARQTISLRASDASSIDCWIPYVYNQSEIYRYLEVVALAGALPVTLEPHVVVLGRDLAESLAVLPKSDDPLVPLHPGPDAPDRRWAPETFAATGDALADAGARVVVIGTELERPLVERVLSTMGPTAEDLGGKLSLGGLVGLLPCCDLVVPNDSGSAHLAAAVGTPTACIFWCLTMMTAGIPGRRRHRPVISWQVTCTSCGTDVAEGGVPAGARSWPASRWRMWLNRRSSSCGAHETVDEKDGLPVGAGSPRGHRGSGGGLRRTRWLITPAAVTAPSEASRRLRAPAVEYDRAA